MAEMNERIEIIYDWLLRNKRGDCPIDSLDRLILKTLIKSKLEKGYNMHQITRHMKWMEYFDNVTDEKTCLQNLTKTIME